MLDTSKIQKGLDITMKLATDNETLASSKVLILYILNKLNKPVSNDELFNLVLSIEDMNYFYFQQFLLDLLENKYISILRESNSTNEVYSLTTLGKETLDLTEDLVPGIIKFKIDNNLDGELKELEEKVSIVSEFNPEDDGAYTVTCKIVENNKIVFEVSSYAGSRDQAKFISDTWKENATSIYPKIINLLTKPNQE